MFASWAWHQLQPQHRPPMTRLLPHKDGTPLNMCTTLGIGSELIFNVGLKQEINVEDFGSSQSKNPGFVFARSCGCPVM